MFLKCFTCLSLTNEYFCFKLMPLAPHQTWITRELNKTWLHILYNVLATTVVLQVSQLNFNPNVLAFVVYHKSYCTEFCIALKRAATKFACILYCAIWCIVPLHHLSVVSVFSLVLSNPNPVLHTETTDACAPWTVINSCLNA